MFYRSSHAFSDDILTLGRAVSRRFRTRFQVLAMPASRYCGLIFHCAYLCGVHVSMIIAYKLFWCMPSARLPHALSVAVHLHFMGLQLLHLWRTSLTVPIVGYVLSGLLLGHFGWFWKMQRKGYKGSPMGAASVRLCQE